MKKYIILLACFLPGLAFGAGFVPDSIWLSNDAPSHGEVIDIFVTVFNTENKNLEGDVLYYDGEVLLGEMPIIISPNSAKLVSFSWEATQGDRVIYAQFNGKGLPSEETKKIRLRVKQPIVPEVSDEESKEPDGEEKVSDNLPSGSVEDFAKKAVESTVSLAEDGFSKTEEGRDSSLNFFERSKEATQDKKDALLSDKDKKANSEFSYNVKKVLLTALIWLLAVLVFISTYKILFYGVIIALLYLLYKTIKRRREAYD